MRRARSQSAALLAMTALLLSGVLPALPHGHQTGAALSMARADETGCPCPDDHVDRPGNQASAHCPICSLTRLAAHAPLVAEDLRGADLASASLPPVSGLLPDRFLASVPEARGPPLS